MRADIDFEERALEVTFRIDAPALAPELAAMLQFQLERLKLNDRYPRQINKFLSEQRTAILMMKEPGQVHDALAIYLQRSATSLSHRFGRNDWRPVLLDALAANARFCAAPEDYLGARPPVVAEQVAA